MKRIASLLAVVLALSAGCKKSEDKKPETKPETKPDTKPETKPETPPDAMPADGEAYKLVTPDTLSYQPLDPKNPEGVQIATAFGNPQEDGPAAFFLKIPAGGDPGIHSHTAAYHAVVVSGSHKHWLPGDKKVKPLAAGSYWYQPGGQPHGDKCEGDKECLLFLIMDGKLDFTPNPDVKKTEDRKDYKLVSAADLKLQPMDPKNKKGPKSGVLFGDLEAGPVVQMFELPGGFSVGMHKHTSDYHGIVVAGTWAHWVKDGDGEDKTLEPGTFWFQPGDEHHNDACRGDKACRLIVYMPEAADFIPEESGDEGAEPTDEDAE